MKTTSGCVSPDGAIDIDIVKYGDYDDDDDEDDPPPPSEPTPPPPSRRKSPSSSSSKRKRRERGVKHERAVFGSSVSTKRNDTIDVSRVPKRGRRRAKPKRGSVWSGEKKKEWR